jgi:prevent-host-death family protein
MTVIPATAARQRWAQTLDAARREPVIISEHGRETVMLLDIEVGKRALQALQDAEDANDAAAAQLAIDEGEETVSLDTIAQELGISLG